MNDVDASKSEKLENQILELWDRVYQKWMSDENDDGIGPKVTGTAVETSWNAFITDLQKSSGYTHSFLYCIIFKPIHIRFCYRSV